MKGLTSLAACIRRLWLTPRQTLLWVPSQNLLLLVPLPSRLVVLREALLLLPSPVTVPALLLVPVPALLLLAPMLQMPALRPNASTSCASPYMCSDAAVSARSKLSVAYTPRSAVSSARGRDAEANARRP